MSITIILLLLGAGVLILPNLGGDDEDDAKSSDNSDEILGGAGNDTIYGTPGNDLIRTFLGDDTIYGGDGNDDIRAGDGADYVEGGEGLNFIRGGAGNDTIFGNEGNDRIISDRGDDYVDGGTGSDIIRGGEGNDTLLGGLNTVLDENGLPTGNFGATDQISGEDGDDLMIAWGGQSTLNGGLNDADAPVNQTNNDTLVAATGEVIMENRTGENVDIALATLEDDQISQATVVDFDRDDDTLVLTVDHTSTADMPDGYTPTFKVEYEAGVSETQGAGTFVTVTWTNPYGTTAETESESATAFLVGYSPTDLDGNLNLDIYLTEDASYADPIATLEGLGLIDPNAVTL